MKAQIKRIVNKFGIEKIERGKNPQIKMFAGSKSCE
jgi:hypothetical protein